jgi:Common central domain of tyrosinase/von Willebrand factor type A domain
MTLGDGIRRDVATVSQTERDLLLDAFLKLDTTKFYPDGVSYWDKEEDIHKNAHFHGLDVHAGPAFIPWHRVLTNRLEDLLREIHPEIALHYWDWTTDPRAASAGRAALFTNTFMGGTGDPAGPPFQDFESTEKTDPFGDGIHDHIWRQVGASGAKGDGTPNLAADDSILLNTEFTAFNAALQSAHNAAHGFIGGSIGDAHFSFHDPFVFLLHSNMDRLWAEWQTDPTFTDRINPATAYGLAVIDPTEHVEPWAGGTGLEPWASDPTIRAVITYRDLSVIAPPCYDTNHQNVILDQVETPGSVINFNDVPTGETAARAAVFKIFMCGDVTLQVKPGTGPNAPYSVLTPGGSVTIHHASTSYVEGRIWFGFTGGAPGAVAPVGAVTIHCVETGQDFPFTLHANSIARPTVAAMLCLDQSGSMGWLAGVDATTKRIDVLHQAADNFVQLVQDNNGVGLVSFDQSAYPGVPVTRFTGGAFDPGRAAAVTAINAIHPAGATSIGNGLQLARSTLSPVTGYDQQALIVFTDGLENTPLFIADVATSINNRTYAVGLGTAEQVSTSALNALTQGTGGYLLLSGPLSPSIDDYFRLTKYFLQILAGVTNNNIVTDPAGYIAPGMELRIPFVLNETDIDITPIVLTDLPAQVLRVRIETPAGDLMGPAEAVALGATFALGTNMSYYRYTLPLPLAGKPAWDGTWYVVLDVDRKYFERYAHDDKQSAGSWSARTGHGVRYSVNIHALSNLKMEARVSQSGFDLGATITVRATLSEYGIPVDHRASVTVDMQRPDGTGATVPLTEVEAGVFEAGTVATMQGVYRFHVVATGLTMRGVPFRREQLLSGAAVSGGDNPAPKSDPSSQANNEALCRLLECLLRPEALGRLLAEHHIDPGVVQKCVEVWCRTLATSASEEELHRREGV